MSTATQNALESAKRKVFGAQDTKQHRSGSSATKIS